MTRSSIGVLTFSAVSLLALGACRNGSNNADDTSGINGSSAAGQMAPAPATVPGGTGTTPDTAAAAGANGAVIPPGGAVDTAGTDTSTKAADTTTKKSGRKSSKKHAKKGGY